MAVINGKVYVDHQSYNGKTSVGRFLDGCHKWGWVINIVITALMLGAAWGSVTTKLDDYGSRIVRIENFLLGEVKNK